MRSIFDILHKNFQEDQLNSMIFSGGFLNSSRFPGFPGVVDTLCEQNLTNMFARVIYGSGGMACHEICDQWDIMVLFRAI